VIALTQLNGVPGRAETIPAEPDPVNTGVGIESPPFVVFAAWHPRY